MVLLVSEKDVEGSQGSIGTGDVLLHLDFFAVGQFFVGVNFLFEDAEIVADHDDFVEEEIEGNFLRLKGWFGGMHHEVSALPAHAECIDVEVGFIQSELRNSFAYNLIDEHGEWQVEAR